jgi:ubiquinone/menaquinone biosynthesis C-methylase UbiE
MTFKDHFSKRAEAYAQYRPGYPDSLFQYLFSLGSGKSMALDCATGNGQAAGGLSKFFPRVVGLDASKKQISNAVAYDHVRYCIAVAERMPFHSKSIDLITVAQALHWLNIPKFFKQAKRVLKPGGHVAVWCYNLLHVQPRVDVILYRFYTDTVGPYWPSERKLTEEGYSSVPFPFDEKEPPTVDMNADWDLNELIGYLRTWSSSQKYAEKLKKDPLDEISQELKEAWGPPNKKRKVRWPLSFRIGEQTS